MVLSLPTEKRDTALRRVVSSLSGYTTCMPCNTCATPPTRFTVGQFLGSTRMEDGVEVDPLHDSLTPVSLLDLLKGGSQGPQERAEMSSFEQK